MGLLFHGDTNDEDSISLADSLLKGHGYFGELWDKIPLNNNEDGNEEAEGGHKLVLKNSISLDHEKNYVANSAFTMNSLQRKSSNSQLPISGRALYDAAKDSWKEMKKALVFASDFMPDGKLPSGKTIEDFFLYVRKGMWAHYYAKKTKAAVNVDDDKAAVTPAAATAPAAEPTVEEFAEANNYIDVDKVVLPSLSWTYIGWACFVCFHPLTSNYAQLPIISMEELTTNTKETKKKHGRAKMREEDRKRAAEGSNISMGSPFKKSLKGGATRRDIARLAVKYDANVEQHGDRAFAAVNAVITSKNMRAERIFLAMTSATTETARTLYSGLYDTAMKEISDLETRLLETADLPKARPAALDHFLSEMIPGEADAFTGSSSAASASNTTAATSTNGDSRIGATIAFESDGSKSE
jgi:hypothetical protein